MITDAIRDYLNRTITEKHPVKAGELSMGCNSYLCDSGLGGAFTLIYLGRENGRCVFSVDNQQSDFHGKRLSWKPAEVVDNVWIEIRRPMEGGAA